MSDVNVKRIATFFAVLLGGVMLWISTNNLLNLDPAVAYAQFKGVPSPWIATIVAQGMLLIAGLFIVTGYRPRAGLLIFLVFLIGVTIGMHRFWEVADPMSREIDYRFFLVNLLLIAFTGFVWAILKNVEWPYNLLGSSNK